MLCTTSVKIPVWISGTVVIVEDWNGIGLKAEKRNTAVFHPQSLGASNTEVRMAIPAAGQKNYYPGTSHVIITTVPGVR